MILAPSRAHARKIPSILFFLSESFDRWGLRATVHMEDEEILLSPCFELDYHGLKIIRWMISQVSRGRGEDLNYEIMNYTVLVVKFSKSV